MTIDYKPILNVGLAAQAANLSFSNLDSINKKRRTLSLARMGMRNVIGISLIQTQSKLIGSL